MNKEHREQVQQAVAVFCEALNLRPTVGEWSELQISLVAHATQYIIRHLHNPAIEEHHRREAALAKGQRLALHVVFAPLRQKSWELRSCGHCGLSTRAGRHCIECGERFAPALNREERLRAMADLGLIEYVPERERWLAIARFRKLKAGGAMSISVEPTKPPS